MENFWTNIYTQLSTSASLIAFYVPLGIIGIWRWSVWLIRKIVSLFYQTPIGNFSGTLAIITPVYNEDPLFFKKALQSWAQNKPDEIIAIIDYSDETSLEIFSNFSQKHPEAKLIVTKKPGKRPALADGIRAAKSEIVALVDSDTVWDKNIKNHLLGPFSESLVGGITMRQDVLETDTLSRKIFKFHLDNRYLIEYPFLATVSDALACLSGRTALYRKSAIINSLDDLVNETFLGKKVISGDDKSLTHLMQKNGWKSKYLRDAIVRTPGSPNMLLLFKQQLRWARNASRSDTKLIFQKWLWKEHKALALYLLDKFIQPFTLLISVAYFFSSLFYGIWQAALLIFAWWMISRAIKMYPHLKEKPSDILILPLYIPITFLTALIRIYAFISMDEQGWITRWDKTRLARLQLKHMLSSLAATAAIITGIFFAVGAYREVKLTEPIKRNLPGYEKVTGKEKSNIFTPQLARADNQELSQKKELLLEKANPDPFGYYVIKSGDTYESLLKKFNLDQTANLLDPKNKNPLPKNIFLQQGQKIAVKTSDLRTPINTTILTTNRFAKPPRITYDKTSNTIFVMEGGSVANLTIISNGLRFINPNLLTQSKKGEWILRANLYVGKNVTLVLSANEISLLKMKSDPSGFIWLLSESGNVLISGIKISSWNEEIKAPDEDINDGRSYITAKDSGRMDVVRSDIGYLGYPGAPNRGGPFGGSYGISWKINSGGFGDNLLTGVVRESSFHNNYFGLYTFGATGMLIDSNKFFKNIEYGLDPHDDSNNLLIVNNISYNNGNHGIILSKRCFNNVIAENISHDNRLHGIMLDRSSNNNLVSDNIIYNNTDGIVLYDSHSNVVYNNKIYNNTKGIRANAGSSENFFENNEISTNNVGIYLYEGAKINTFLNNDVRENEVGIVLKDADNNILFDNLKPLDNKKDGQVTEDSQDNNIQ